MRRRLTKILIWTGVGIVVIVAAAAGVAVTVVVQGRPQTGGTLALPGLAAPVEIVRDRWGVAHIYARSEPDLVFAQGYYAAGERLFQMDFFRRVSRGRLSEVFGMRTLQADRFLRTIGIGRAADAEAAAMSAADLAPLEAFARGVNAYITSRGSRLPPEFRLLRYRPEPWRPADTIAFAKLMAWDLNGNWQSEVLRAALIKTLGAAAAMLLPGYPAGAPIIAPTTGGALSREYGRVADGLGLHVPGVGSNNWVVAGSRSETGKPLLANDPHLGIQMPSIWYEVHLVGGRFDVAGAAFAAAPGVVIGHNRRIAWGFTNASLDLQDLYIERLDPKDPSRYLVRGRWEPLRVIREEIRVKGRGAPVVLDVRITRHGPIITDLVERETRPLALRWVALDVAPIAPAILRLDLAGTFQEFRDALREWRIAPQNSIYADVDGNIGYQLPGLIPVRARGRGLVPVPGWTDEYEWTGWIPFDRLPSVYNPPGGMIVTANNRIVPDEYPFFLSDEWDPGFRARRITALLEGRVRHDADSFAAIQYDVYQGLADILLPDLLTLHPGDPDLQAALGVLRAWDRQMTVESPGAALFEAIRTRLIPAIVGDELGPDLLRQYRSAGAFAQPEALRRLFEQPAHRFWDDVRTEMKRESKEEILTAVFTEAVRDLEQRLGSDPTRWRWGTIHHARFQHVMGSVPLLGLLLNGGEYKTPGSSLTVNNAGYDPATGLQRTVASYRQIVDLADYDHSRSVHTTGQSGVPATRHYRDLTPLWVRGRHHPQLYSREAILREAESTLILQPR